MNSIELGEKLNLNSDNLAETWKDFRQNFEIYMLATESTNKPEPVQVAIFLNAIGPESVKLYNTFGLTDQEKCTLARVLEEFEKYCTKSRNTTLNDTYLFGKRRQTAYETFNAFVDDLKRMVKLCEYEDEDRMVRDRIVFGVLDRELQRRYFAWHELDLDTAIQLGREAENERKEKNDELVIEQPNMSMQTTTGKMRFRLCAYCYLRHTSDIKCPAVGKMCTNCNKLNHFAAACHSKQVNNEKYESSTGWRK